MAAWRSEQRLPARGRAVLAAGKPARPAYGGPIALVEVPVNHHREEPVGVDRATPRRAYRRSLPRSGPPAAEPPRGQCTHGRHLVDSVCGCSSHKIIAMLGSKRN